MVVTFLARSCFTSNGMHIPFKTWVLILTLYLLGSAYTSLQKNLEKNKNNLLHPNHCLINLSVSSLCIIMKVLKLENATALGERTRVTLAGLHYCANSFSQVRLHVARLYLYCRISHWVVIQIHVETFRIFTARHTA